MKDREILHRICGGVCVVLGYGISNRPLIRWLAEHGAASITVRDERTPEIMASMDGWGDLQAVGATYVGGPTYLDGLDQEASAAAQAGQAYLLFRTPGLRPDKGTIPAAVAAGAILTSEMELFLEVTPATVLAVTGSDGKTTSTTLSSLMIEQALAMCGVGHMYLGGNIGTPLLPLVEQMTPDDVAVVELSSFQLMTAHTAPFRAAITNLAENHLNWHVDMAEYVAAKANLLAYQPMGGAVLNRENTFTVAMGQHLPPEVPVIWFSSVVCGWESVVPPERQGSESRDAAVFERNGYIVYATREQETALLEIARIRLPGRHNLENYMTALALTQGWVTPQIACQVADSFTGVPHRLELIREMGDVRYYNSSIDSSPTRTAAALAALEDMNQRAVAAGGAPRRLPIVICGGRDKHVDMAPLAVALCRSTSAVVLTGEARALLYQALQACPQFDPEKLPVTVIPDWDQAMITACRMAKAGDTVLLSPACTSFDAFRNFEERGRRFAHIVQSL